MIKIVTLVDNMVYKKRLKAEHGLSLFIVKDDKKILFDFGQTDIIYENAKELGINIKEIDLGIISHGHYDHTGGLEDFLRKNRKATIYISKDAFLERYNSRNEEIGIKNKTNILSQYSKRFKYINNENEIFDCFYVFGKLRTKNYTKGMKIKTDSGFIEDTFKDEIYLLIKDNGKNILISGCSHKGIVEIVKETKSRFNLERIDFLLGGMHLIGKNEEEVYDVKNKLYEINVKKIIPMHCTGYTASAIIDKQSIKGVGSEYIL